MTNTYRALSVAAKSEHGDAPVDLDLSVVDERDALDGGHLELVPRTYRVLTNNFSGGPEGSEYVGALQKEIEAALISGGHLERIDAGSNGGPTSFKEVTADGGPGGKAASKQQKKED
jgi:hypothetical protein